jgi:hypothetical protein
MSRGQDRGTLDWLVELAGAVVPAGAGGYAAVLLAPSFGFAPGLALLAGFCATFVLAFSTMRAIPPEPRLLVLPAFAQPELQDDVLLLVEALARDELLLDTPYVAPGELLLDTPLDEPADLSAVAELVLDDPLPAPTPDSRVVQLFAGGRMPTAGQLQQRIDRHLAASERPAVVRQDASDALSEALAELRRSLRQA